VINLPGTRKLVIDSKVSLLAYWDLCAEEDPDARVTHLSRITLSLKQHIDGLYRKPYNEVAGTPDYLVMFVPVEAAYITALQHDHTLWQYAYSKGVVLISPTNLIPFIRVVQNLWDRDDKYRNAEAIAEKAGKLYDKLVTFVTSYQKVGSELEAAQRAYSEGIGQLATGRDNLISQAEKMKMLNISNKKSLPPSLTESASLSNEIQL
jgi:DNA recombination protein RmuC